LFSFLSAREILWNVQIVETILNQLAEIQMVHYGIVHGVVRSAGRSFANTATHPRWVSHARSVAMTDLILYESVREGGANGSARRRKTKSIDCYVQTVKSDAKAWWSKQPMSRNEAWCNRCNKIVE